MAVTSVRFSKQEERAMEYLKEVMHADSSSIIRRAVAELYEDTRDREIIEEFEVRESAGEVSFLSAEDIGKE